MFASPFTAGLSCNNIVMLVVGIRETLCYGSVCTAEYKSAEALEDGLLAIHETIDMFELSKVPFPYPKSNTIHVSIGDVMSM